MGYHVKDLADYSYKFYPVQELIAELMHRNWYGDTNGIIQSLQ